MKHTISKSNHHYFTDLRDHGIIVDADVTSLLDTTVYTDLTGQGTEKTVLILPGQVLVPDEHLSGLCGKRNFFLNDLL